MAPMTPAERQKKYRERLKNGDPEKLERLKKENAERTKRNYKKIKELPKNVQEENRKKWRLQKKKQKQVPKIYRITEEKDKRKIRYVLSKENSMLTAKVQYLQHIIRKQRRNIYFFKNKLENMQMRIDNLEKASEEDVTENLDREASTPMSKTNAFIVENNIPASDKDKVRKVVFEGYVLKESLSQQYKKAESKSEKDVLKNVVNNDIVKKYKLKTELGTLCTGLRGRLRQKQIIIRKKRLKMMSEVECFLERDDNSRLTAGKRETRTYKKDKRQIRYLLNSLQNLHKKYKQEGGQASHTTFTRYKPFYILDPTITQRNTCACVRHANLTFLAQKLKILGILATNDLDKLVSDIVCDKLNEKCMYSKCNACENKMVSIDLTNINKDVIVTWNAWVTKTHEYMKSNNQVNERKMTKRTTKDVISDTIETLIKSFIDQLQKFKKHYYNIYHANKMYQKCKETLTETECIIHCDFSENYLCKSNEEVQATHFGASKQQFTLHTGVMYYKYEQELQEKSFCTISPNNKHDPSAIWAHLTPILEYIRKSLRNVNTIHFFSDGPTTQYRQKGNFFLMSKFINKLGFKKSTWSFFESAHGKGAADGIGGAVKRNLDKKVCYGEDIVNAKSAYDILRKCQTKIMYFYISDENIQAVEQEVNFKELVPVPQTMELHQVITTGQVEVVQYRKLSCFCTDNLCECYGLQQHNLKYKKQKRKLEDGKTDHIEKEYIKKKRPNKPSKRISILRADDSDTTSVESNITFAESNDSVWNIDDEIDLNDNDFNEEITGNINAIDKTEKSVHSEGKKVTLLSDIKNTPENRRYFNLKDYQLTLHRVDKISKENYGHNISITSDEHKINESKEINTNQEVKTTKETTVEEFIDGEHEFLRENYIIINEKKYAKKEFKTEDRKEDRNKNNIPSTSGENKKNLNENKDINTNQEVKTTVGEIIDKEHESTGEYETITNDESYANRKCETEERNEDRTSIFVNNKEYYYNVHDSVLVRYYEKKTWIYYIGFIQDVQTKTDNIYYTVRFLKTVKKPHLKFIHTKNDKDTVPKECIVKTVDLSIGTNCFMLKNDSDLIYFSK